MEDKIRVQITFTEQTEHGEFRDALYYTPEAYDKLDPKDLTAMKQERIDNWIYGIEHPAPMIEPTKEMLEQELRDIEDRKIELAIRKTEVQDKISIKG